MVARFAASLVVWKSEGKYVSTRIPTESVGKAYKEAEITANARPPQEEKYGTALAKRCELVVKLTRDLHSEIQKGLLGPVGGTPSVPFTLSAVQVQLSEVAFHVSALALWKQNGKL